LHPGAAAAKAAATAAATAVKAEMLAYQATQDKSRRQSPQTHLKDEGKVLPDSTRKKLVATAQDQARNIATVAWAIRCHLDYVSRFFPQVKTASAVVNARAEALFAQHARRQNFDVLRRHSRDEMLRLFEATKVIQGDAGLLLTDRWRVMGIEGDRIAKPTSFDNAARDVVATVEDDGLVLDADKLAAAAYCLCKRDDYGTKMFDQIVPAASLAFDAYYPLRFDSRRGVSPLAAALNSFQDLTEAQEWTLLKVKLAALFGIAYEKESKPGVPVTDPFTSAAEDANAGDTDVYDHEPIEMKDGVAVINANPGEKVHEIQSATPNPQLVEWLSMVTRVALLAIDLPYSFFDSKGSSFSGRIADGNMYEESCASKRAKNAEVLDMYSRWIVPHWLDTDPQLRAAVDAAGILLPDLLDAVAWIPAGMPWLDKLSQVNGDVLAIANGLDSRTRVCRRRGADLDEILDELASEEKRIKARGLQITIGVPGAPTIGGAKPAPAAEPATDEPPQEGTDDGD
jgi:capsid protein